MTRRYRGEDTLRRRPANALHLCLRRVGLSSCRQEIRQIETRRANPVIRHSVIHVEVVRCAKIVTPVNARGKHDVGDDSVALLRQLGRKHQRCLAVTDYERMLLGENHHPCRVAQLAIPGIRLICFAHTVVNDQPAVFG